MRVNDVNPVTTEQGWVAMAGWGMGYERGAARKGGGWGREWR